VVLAGLQSQYQAKKNHGGKISLKHKGKTIKSTNIKSGKHIDLKNILQRVILVSYMDMIQFKDRIDGANQLAKLLSAYKNTSNVVLGIPRGGVVTAKIIADKLNLPLGIVVVRKIGHPNNPEYAIAAVSESGILYKNELETANLSEKWIKQETNKELQEANRRRSIYWGKRQPLSFTDKTIILIDDGLATGITMFAAILEVKKQHPQKIIVAVPITPEDTRQKILHEADDFVAVSSPSDFLGGVGNYYRDFPQVEDREVIELLCPQHPQS